MTALAISVAGPLISAEPMLVACCLCGAEWSQLSGRAQAPDPEQLLDRPPFGVDRRYQ
jgi:hypothetical protein